MIMGTEKTRTVIISSKDQKALFAALVLANFDIRRQRLIFVKGDNGFRCKVLVTEEGIEAIKNSSEDVSVVRAEEVRECANA